MKTKKRGKSKYARKVSRRRRIAAKLSLPANTPWPVLTLYLGATPLRQTRA